MQTQQRCETLKEAGLSFLCWLSYPNQLVLFDDADEIAHIYTKDYLARRVIVYNGDRFRFDRLGTEAEHRKWLGAPSTEDLEEQ